MPPSPPPRTNCCSPPRPASLPSQPSIAPNPPSSSSSFDTPLDVCPVCGLDWDDSQNKQAHLSLCLDNLPHSSDPDPDPDPDQLAIPNDDLELALASRANSPPPSLSLPSPAQTSKPLQPVGVPNLPSLLRQLLLSSLAAGQTRSALLSNPDVIHIRSTSSTTHLGPGDWAWGCGYRNMQMLFSALRHLPVYKPIFAANPLLSPPSPSGRPLTRPSSVHPDALEPSDIPSINVWQQIIEAAWRAGFDPEGAAHFSGRLVGKRKWIGTTEAYVALSSLAVRARIIDFPQPSGPNGMHLKLLNWVEDYFSASVSSPALPGVTAPDAEASPINLTTKLPLYLQHAGHSRTIVGIETDAAGARWLLVLDPAKTVSRALQMAAHTLSSPARSTPSTPPSEPAPSSRRSASPLSVPASPRPPRWRLPALLARRDAPPPGAPLDPKLLAPHRISLKALSRKKQYQILCVEEGGPLSEEEQAGRYVISSTRIE